MKTLSIALVVLLAAAASGCGVSTVGQDIDPAGSPALLAPVRSDPSSGEEVATTIVRAGTI
ncbi:MAG: hypothetical protein VYE73_07645, partial [Acidobacteriota bacterium]|nr:hypothetical protein [Acidobacteriota bacterium]